MFVMCYYVAMHLFVVLIDGNLFSRLLSKYEQHVLHTVPVRTVHLRKLSKDVAGTA